MSCKAFDFDCTFFRAVEGYGACTDEQLVDRALVPVPAVGIATKLDLGSMRESTTYAKLTRVHITACAINPSAFISCGFPKWPRRRTLLADCIAFRGALICWGRFR